MKPKLFKSTASVATALVLAGCASVNFDQAVSETNQIASAFTSGQLALSQTAAQNAALMVKFPTMEHDEPYMAHVGPGKTGQIVWNFNKAGSFDFACLIAGHYTAGMVGKVTVLAT